MQQWRPFIYMGFASLCLTLIAFGMWIFAPKQDSVVETLTFFLEMGDQGEASGLVAVERSLRPRQLEIRGLAEPATQISEPIVMTIEVKSQPDSTIVFQEKKDLPLDGKGQWLPFRAEFLPRQEGEHLISVKAGKPVRSVQVTVDR